MNFHDRLRVPFGVQGKSPLKLTPFYWHKTHIRKFLLYIQRSAFKLKSSTNTKHAARFWNYQNKVHESHFYTKMNTLLAASAVRCAWSMYEIRNQQEGWLSPTERASDSAISLRYILASPGYATGTIAVDVTWMERGFNAGQTHSSIYPTIFNRLRAIARYWSEIATFSYPLHLTHQLLYLLYLLPTGGPGKVWSSEN